MSHREPAFPSDLEREIFETTAILYPGRSLPCYALLAASLLGTFLESRLRTVSKSELRIEPLLYGVICLEHGKHSNNLVPALLKKPPEFIHMAVRHLALFLSSYSQAEVKQLRGLCRVCTGAVELVSASPGMQPPLHPEVLSSRMRLLQRLYLRFQDLRPFDLTHALFTTLTHLSIVGMSQSDFTQHHLLFPQLPALTHLALFGDIPRGLITEMLAQWPRLEVFLLLWSGNPTEISRYSSACVPHAPDDRFVVGRFKGCLKNWEARAKGLAVDNYWFRAADFVARKRRGEIEGTSIRSRLPFHVRGL
ncbi:hypothetical protein C8R46DRAFT_1303597 [Mycena filopes]|nr:hypothetical protein C8R46DRAFT_1303597 [Mycena filopes]